MAPSPSRLQPVMLPNGAWLLRDDFKGSMETFDAALDVLEQVPARRRIVVLGDMDEVPGSVGPVYRRIGERLAGIASRVILTGGTDRGRYRAGATQAGMDRHAIVDVGNDLRRAVEAVAADLSPGDAVLVKGRHYQQLSRVSLALAGRTVRCTISECHLTMLLCDHCPMLERGWDKLPSLT